MGRDFVRHTERWRSPIDQTAGGLPVQHSQDISQPGQASAVSVRGILRRRVYCKL